MMKVFVSILMSVLFLSSCVKQEPKPQKPNPSTPIITNPVPTDSTLSLAGQTWVVTKVQYTDATEPENRSDTLVFINTSDYTFNGYPRKYDLEVTTTNYKLSLYNTPWLETGNITVSLPSSFNLFGVIDGLDFYDIFNSSRKVKLWITKI
jgi:hypothetical protein